MEIIEYLNTKATDSASYFRIWPVSNPIAIVQFVTGMSDYIDRYDHFFKFLNKNKVLVIGHDHIGQGKSVTNRTMLGNLAGNNLELSTPQYCVAYKNLINQTALVTRACNKFFPEIPLIVIGHSLGSLVITQLLKEKDLFIHGAIMLGVVQPPESSKVLLRLLERTTSFNSSKLRNIVNEFAYKLYNRDFSRDEPNSWVTSETMIRRALQTDPLIGYEFTLNSLFSILKLAINSGHSDWLAGLPKSFPIFALSGSLDPAGEYGLRLFKLCEQFTTYGLRFSKTKLLFGKRHELLFEKNATETYLEILTFILSHI